MKTTLADTILEKLDALPADHIESILRASKDVTTYTPDKNIRFGHLPKNAVVVGNNMKTSDVYKMVNENSAHHIVQLDRKDALFELILSGLLCKQPDELIKPDSTFLLQRFTQKDDIKPKSLTVSFRSSKEKEPVLQQIEDFLQPIGKLRHLITHVVQIADELMMNALFDAPVDRFGKRIFMHTPRRNLVEYPDIGKSAKIKIYYDQSRLLIGCEDPWGSMDEHDVRAHLSHVLSGKVGLATQRGEGAGLGLKMIVENSTSFYLFVRRRTLTCVYCSFDLSVSYKEISETSKHCHIVFTG